ncbi:AtpZ/AtpI family protein [Hyphobacterium indicum]|uniref:AtpZ/AtpI family protein n=1 Tax=Hyphobacterium indicum TaxID=2162714 RepID=UPI001F1D0A38|nr:AtpZ/AtpI family protein [Hyphobacterium indicum]
MIMMSNRDEPDRSNPEDRLADFEKRLSARLESRNAEDRKYDRPRQGWAIGLRYGTEFMVGVLVGAAIGYLIDRVFDTLPFGLLIGTFLGFGAGTMNVVRAAKELSERALRDN